MLVKAGMTDASPDNDAGLISLERSSVADFIKTASAGRIWEREPSIRNVP
jgi:catalase